MQRIIFDRFIEESSQYLFLNELVWNRLFVLLVLLVVLALDGNDDVCCCFCCCRRTLHPALLLLLLLPHLGWQFVVNRWPQPLVVACLKQCRTVMTYNCVILVKQNLDLDKKALTTLVLFFSVQKSIYYEPIFFTSNSWYQQNNSNRGTAFICYQQRERVFLVLVVPSTAHSKKSFI